MNKIKQQLTFSFDGIDYKKHEIDIATYIESLEGLVDLVTQANKITNGESSNIEMKVVAEKPGSFETVVDFYQNGGQDILLAIGLAGGAAVSGSLLGVVEKLKGRPINEIEVKTEAKNKVATIHVDNEEISCSEITSKLLKNPKIRAGIDKLIHQPLSKDGTSIMKVKKDDQVTLQIENVDAQTYKSPASLIVVESKTDKVEGNVNFTKINFNGAAGWEILYGPLGHFSVRMEDEEFLKRINLRDSDGKGVDISSSDMFEVDMIRTVEEVNGRFRKNKYIVEKVKRHRKHVGKLV